MMFWLTKTILIMLGLAVFTISIPFFEKNYGLKAENTMLIWLIGSVVGMVLFMDSSTKAQLFIGNLLIPILLMFILGTTLGAFINIAVSQVIMAAPNPAIPIVILGFNSVLVYLAAPVLFHKIPQYFAQAEFSTTGLVGCLVAFIGCTIVALDAMQH